MTVPDTFGKKLGKFKWRFGRSENSNLDINISKQIQCADVDGLEYSTQYGVSINPIGGQSQPFEDEHTFIAETYNDRPRFTVPLETVKDCGLKPGHTVYVTMYEYDPSEKQKTLENTDPISNDCENGVWETIGHSTTQTDTNGARNAGSKLNSRQATSYIGNSELLVKFVNVENGKTALGHSYTYDSNENAVYFPSEVRHSIEASPGDKIRLEVCVQSDNPNTEQTLAELRSEVEQLNKSFDDLAEVVLQIKKAVRND